MQFLELVQQNLLASKTLVSSIEETPVISAIEVEFIPNKQKLESFLSDAMSLASTTKGRLKHKRGVSGVNGLVRQCLIQKGNMINVRKCRSVKVMDEDMGEMEFVSTVSRDFFGFADCRRAFLMHNA